MGSSGWLSIAPFHRNGIRLKSIEFRPNPSNFPIMSQPRITLEQWRALQAVVESGGYAQAAEALHKSQSTLTYAVQKIERLLGLKIFEIQGRKAVLTKPGEVLYRRAKTLI